MHVPDGFLDAKTAIATATLSVAGLSAALRHARRHLPDKRVPLLGMAAAFVFAAQMLNFPVAGGTSGHLVGGALAAVLLGPSVAVIVISAVLIVQCFMFADGGITALGANVFNMAIAGSVGGYAVYWFVHKLMPGKRGKITGAAFGAWFSTVAAAVCCAGELAMSGTASWSVAFPTMAGIHMLIGIGEGLITAMVLLAVSRTRPDLFGEETAAAPAPAYGTMVIYGLLIALGLALFVSPLASAWPDGLEKVAANLGFEHHAAKQPLLPAPIPDYIMPGIPWAVAATSIAGAIGTIVVFILAALLARFMVPKARSI